VPAPAFYRCKARPSTSGEKSDHGLDHDHGHGLDPRGTAEIGHANLAATVGLTSITIRKIANPADRV
jgi:hypothetical protein